ncbi:sterol desaturase family protein [Sandarakinorhabdus sp.]|uniref:sterol desaturase family protein n=1 Tax=Sandarakinorhabdus sp. TaxID=1916663 RepID=UPI00286E4D08|nr:sterol desaturase family protein [Sandarakinorhabdus sp.]
MAGLLWAERRRPLRGDDSGPVRVAVNLALGAVSLAVMAPQRRITAALAGRVAARGQGVVQQLAGPVWLRDAAAFALLDWSMYHWHVATHRVPAFWRLHLVHHADQAMDTSTALRFHALDMALSLPLRMAQVRLLGVSPRALMLWEGFFGASVLFHHSNWRVPADAAVSLILTTPAMHDIHHRADAAGLDSNYSSGFSLWDRLHGTFRSAAVTAPIGVPELDHAPGLAGSLLLPFAAPLAGGNQ